MRWTFLAAVMIVAPGVASAQDTDADLAKKLANPVSELISVPLQLNQDCCYGPNDAGRTTLNIQPVIPIGLGSDWNLIVRTIVPLVDQESPAPGVEEKSGFADTSQSFFFSPSQPTASGLVWAVGPVMLWPTGTDGLSSGRWGAGPTGLLLKQGPKVTYGVLASQLWSYAGREGREDVSQAFVQPFISYTTATHTTWSMNTEAGYDWIAQEWNVPLNLSVSQLMAIGKQRLSVGGGGKIYLAGQPDWGVRVTVTFLFPK